MEFAYAAFGIPSPRNMPIWWHPGSSFPKSETQKVVETFRMHKFDLCVFLLDPTSRQPDFTRLPNEIIAELKRTYERIDYPDIVVFTRKPSYSLTDPKWIVVSLP